MKQKGLLFISIFIYLCLGFFTFFVAPQFLYAQNSDCDTSIAHKRLPVYFYDQRGVQFGETGNTCINAPYQGAGISRVSGVKNTYFTCNENNGSVIGAFIARSYRCNGGTMVFDTNAPPGFTCANSLWKYMSTGGGFGSESNTEISRGYGCRVTVPYSNDFTRQVIRTIDLPDPGNPTLTCNNNQTATIRWNAVTGATQYGWRLDNQANSWYTASSDTYGYTAATTFNIPLQYGATYRWAVTATNSAGKHPQPTTWSANFSCPPAPPTNQTYTCNSNGTATFSWNSVPGATSYVPRLNRITSPDQWRNIGQGDTGANMPGITSTSAVYSLRDASNYQWAVSSVVAGVQSTWAWRDVSCLTIRARNSAGTAVSVRGLGYTYNISGLVFSNVTTNLDTFGARAVGGWQGGGGIVLNSNQQILNVTSTSTGGARNTLNGRSSTTIPWYNNFGVTWNNYWWPSYPANAVRSVTFIVASVTPTPTPTPPITCGTITNTAGTAANTSATFTARISGITSTTTGCDLRIDGVSADTGTSLGNPRRCDMATNVRAGTHTYNIRGTNGANSLSCRTVTFCGDNQIPNTPGGRVLSCNWTGVNGTGQNLYTVNYSYTAAADNGCAGMSTTAYQAQMATNPARNASGSFVVPLNADNSTWEGGAAGLVSSIAGRPEGQIIYAQVRSRDAVNNPSNWSPIAPAVNASNRITLNAVNCTGVPTPTAVPPTPTPAYWFKLRDSSFNRVTTDTYLRIPNNPLRFNTNDPDDPNPAVGQLIIGRNGLVTSNSTLAISGGGTSPTLQSYKNNYIINRRQLQDAATLTAFRTTLVETKDTKTITNISQIEANKINIFTGNLAINSSLPNGPFVLFVIGNINLNTYGVAPFRFDSTNTNQSIAIISTGTIFIHQNYSEVNGIFIANTVQLTTSGVVTPNLPPLKINGNLISINAVNDDIRLSTDQRMPSLFVVFKPQMYLDLLPLLSTITHEGRQLQ